MAVEKGNEKTISSLPSCGKGNQPIKSPFPHGGREIFLNHFPQWEVRRVSLPFSQKITDFAHFSRCQFVFSWFFFHVRREIQKNLFPFYMGEGKLIKISSREIRNAGSRIPFLLIAVTSFDKRDIFLNNWLFSFLHFASFHISFLDVTSTMFFLNFICLTFLIVFFFCHCFWRISVNLCLDDFSFICDVVFVLRNQNDLLSLLDFAHDIVLSITSVKSSCNFLMLSSICSFVFEFLIDEAHFFVSFTFCAFINFQSFRSTIDVVTMFSSIFVNIEMWSNNWLISDLALQCSILLISSLKMKIKLIVLCEFLAFIVSWESVNCMFVSSITSINLFVKTFFDNFKNSFHKEWCRLKSLSTMCFVSISFIHLSITDIVLTLSVEK